MNQIPIIDRGKYAGTPLDQLPNSYLRWMVTQDFPEEWLAIARHKLKSSEFYNNPIGVSRHAIDKYSKWFLERWINSEGKKENGLGLASFIAECANDAWVFGFEVRQARHQDDGLPKQYEGIVWVFNKGSNSEFKDVITLYRAD